MLQFQCERIDKMQVQLNSATQNVNFGVKFTKSAEAYINESIKNAEKICCNPFTKVGIENAKQSVETIKNTEPAMHKYAKIDLSSNRAGKYFVYKVYKTAKDMKDDNAMYTESLSNYLFNYRNVSDLLSDIRAEVMPILCRRPDSDFVDKNGWDVRNHHRCDYGNELNLYSA